METGSNNTDKTGRFKTATKNQLLPANKGRMHANISTTG